MDKLDIVTDESGNKVVLLPEIIFSNKQNINWDDVEDYLGKYVGELIEIAETRDIIYIGNKFPDEYGGSSYTRKTKGTRTVYSACLVVNHAANGKMYLYDVVGIKKEASNPLKTIK